MEDFKTIKANAWSLPPGETRGVLIHVEQSKYGTFKYYYEESTRTYWYQSSGTESFERWIKEKGKERKECLRRSRSASKRDSA